MRVCANATRWTVALLWVGAAAYGRAQLPAAGSAQLPRAEVTFSQGQLQVETGGSSLNQILHDVARLIGMRIEGTVADERVYGSYGPAPPGGIVLKLVEGTGTNMLLVESHSAMPLTLILTPREGRVTPPGTGAKAALNNRDAWTPQASSQQDGVMRRDLVLHTELRAAFAGVSNVSAAANAAVGNEPLSPNGVKTPEQIRQELWQLARAMGRSLRSRLSQ
jgi:hypothetical protein